MSPTNQYYYWCQVNLVVEANDSNLYLNLILCLGFSSCVVTLFNFNRNGIKLKIILSNKYSNNQPT